MDLRKTHEHPRIFDAVLVLLVVIGLLISGGLLRMGGVWSVLGYSIVICAAVLVYAATVAPRYLKVRRYTESLVPSPAVRLRVAFLSDLHAGSFRSSEWFVRVVRETQALQPDLILLGGDYVIDRADPIVDLRCLSALSAPLGRYFVLGNHDLMDRPQVIREALSSYGFEDLTNRSVQICRQDRKLEVQGLDGHWFGHPRRFKRTLNELPHLTLAHEPDALLDLSEGDTDLVLAGHTHGGQVRLPVLGALWPIPAKLGRRVDQGKKVVNGVSCIISNGLGETDSRMRLLSPPEIVLVEVGI